MGQRGILRGRLTPCKRTNGYRNPRNSNGLGALHRTHAHLSAPGAIHRLPPKVALSGAFLTADLVDVGLSPTCLDALEVAALPLLARRAPPCHLDLASGEG